MTTQNKVVVFRTHNLFNMKTSEKIDFGFKRELLSRQNPFLNFAKRIKQSDGYNFIVEWQMGENDKKEVVGDKVYGMLI
jgi:hypothetical protein